MNEIHTPQSVARDERSLKHIRPRRQVSEGALMFMSGALGLLVIVMAMLGFWLLAR